jgi:hypothetical protein
MSLIRKKIILKCGFQFHKIGLISDITVNRELVKFCLPLLLFLVLILTGWNDVSRVDADFSQSLSQYNLESLKS